MTNVPTRPLRMLTLDTAVMRGCRDCADQQDIIHEVGSCEMFDRTDAKCQRYRRVTWRYGSVFYKVDSNAPALLQIMLITSYY